jgi:hypothetical protein
MARCWARLFFFLALLASEYLSAERTGEECCLVLFSGVAFVPEPSTAVLSTVISIFSPQARARKRAGLTTMPIASPTRHKNAWLLKLVQGRWYR